MDRKPPYNQPPDDGSRKPIKTDEQKRLLDELESINDMLDFDEDDYDPDAPGKFDDLPVLKSFVEDVPMLSDRLVKTEKEVELTPKPETNPENNPPLSSTYGTRDDSFVDRDPLDISDAVRHLRSGAPVEPPLAEPPKPAASRPVNAQGTPVSRFSGKSQPSSDNPFLPQAALDRLRDSKASDSASQELRDLIRKPKPKAPAFNTDPNSKEYKELRDKASRLVNELVKSYAPRIESELRMRLETEVDAIFKTLRKGDDDH